MLAAHPVVLVVEDDVLTRFMIAETLRASVDATVIEADNAHEALAYIRADPNVRVLFTDIQMPLAAEGLELVEQVRDSYPHVRVIMTSGHPLPSRAPASAVFLAKPYPVASVIELIRTALES